MRGMLLEAMQMQRVAKEAKKRDVERGG